MADPVQTTNDALEAAKTAGIGGGGAGLGFILSKLLDRWLSREDESAKATLALLTEIKTGLGNLSTDVKLVMQAHAATRADVDKLEGVVSALQLQFAELKGKFEHLSEQLAK